MAGQPSPMPVRRRPLAERRVLDYLRRDYCPSDNDMEVPPHALPFYQLRKLALNGALHIHPAGAPYVGEDELRLLAWIARAQRYRGVDDDGYPDGRLTRSIFHCAGILTGIGILLPAVTMLAGGRALAGEAVPS
ncbi:MAG: hypothetical protein QM690_01300 [Sphingobium sp.]